jgi:hypothetical protein
MEQGTMPDSGEITALKANVGKLAEMVIASYQPALESARERAARFNDNTRLAEIDKSMRADLEQVYKPLVDLAMLTPGPSIVIRHIGDLSHVKASS